MEMCRHKTEIRRNSRWVSTGILQVSYCAKSREPTGNIKFLVIAGLVARRSAGTAAGVRFIQRAYYHTVNLYPALDLRGDDRLAIRGRCYYCISNSGDGQRREG